MLAYAPSIGIHCFLDCPDRIEYFLSAAPPLSISPISRETIQGKVLDPAGKPVPQARVRAIRLQPTRSTSPAVQADRDGNFTIPGLLAGTYVLCPAPVPSRGLVGDCYWLDAGLSPSRNPNLFQLASGQKPTPVTVRLVVGQKVKIQVQDTGKAIGAKNPKGGVRTLQVELAGPAGTIGRTLVATRPERDGQSYETLIPVGSAFRLRMNGYGLSVADDSGKPLPNGKADQNVQLPAAAGKALQFVFRVNAQN